MRIVPRTAVITGAPGAGKTALIDELAQRGFRTVPEAARAILREPGGMALRASDPLGFAEAMRQRELTDLEAVPIDGEWTIFDRGFGDTVGFLRLARIEQTGFVARLAASKRYSGPVFVAPAWEDIFHTDAERNQTWEEAVASGAAVVASWQELGYELVELPVSGVAERADFVAARLARG